MHMVKRNTAHSNGQESFCEVVKQQNDGQNFLTPVAAVTTAVASITGRGADVCLVS